MEIKLITINGLLKTEIEITKCYCGNQWLIKINDLSLFLSLLFKETKKNMPISYLMYKQ
jgi:hypothetical protein